MLYVCFSSVVCLTCTKISNFVFQKIIQSTIKPQFYTQIMCFSWFLCISYGPGQMPTRKFPGFCAILSGTHKKEKSVEKISCSHNILQHIPGFGPVFVVWELVLKFHNKNYLWCHNLWLTPVLHCYCFIQGKNMSLNKTQERGQSSNEKNLSLLGKKPQSASI